MKCLLLLTLVSSYGNPLLGIILPALVLIISFILTWMLFRKFSRKE